MTNEKEDRVMFLGTHKDQSCMTACGHKGGIWTKSKNKAMVNVICIPDNDVLEAGAR